MESADSDRSQALRRGGRKAEGHTHAGTPQLQVSSEKAKA